MGWVWLGATLVSGWKVEGGWKLDEIFIMCSFVTVFFGASFRVLLLVNTVVDFQLVDDRIYY